MGDFSWVYDDLANATGDKSYLKMKPAPVSKGLDVPGILDDEFSKLGYSAPARTALIANVGRENSWNPTTIFGGHNDPANGERNQGIFSYQKDRRDNLNNFIKQKGGDWAPSEKNLRLQAQFADNELTSPKYASLRTQLKDPNLTTDEAYPILQKYIKYQPQYEADNKKWAAKFTPRDAPDYSFAQNDIKGILGDAPLDYSFAHQDIADALGQDAQQGTLLQPGEQLAPDPQAPTEPVQPAPPVVQPVAQPPVQVAPTQTEDMPPRAPVVDDTGIDNLDSQIKQLGDISTASKAGQLYLAPFKPNAEALAQNVQSYANKKGPVALDSDTTTQLEAPQWQSNAPVYYQQSKADPSVYYVNDKTKQLFSKILTAGSQKPSADLAGNEYDDSGELSGGIRAVLDPKTRQSLPPVARKQMNALTASLSPDERTGLAKLADQIDEGYKNGHPEVSWVSVNPNDPAFLTTTFGGHEKSHQILHQAIGDDPAINQIAAQLMSTPDGKKVAQALRGYGYGNNPYDQLDEVIAGGNQNQFEGLKRDYPGSADAFQRVYTNALAAIGSRYGSNTVAKLQNITDWNPSTSATAQAPVAGQPVQPPVQAPAPVQPTPQSAPAFDPKAFAQANAYLKSQGQPEITKEQYLEAQQGTPNVETSLNPSDFAVSGTPVTSDQFQTAQTTQGGGQIATPTNSEATQAQRSDPNSRVAVYNSSPNATEEETFKDALVSAGASPDKVDSLIQRMKAQGLPLIEGGYTPGQQINVLRKSLTSAGVPAPKTPEQLAEELKQRVIATPTDEEYRNQAVQQLTDEKKLDLLGRLYATDPNAKNLSEQDIAAKLPSLLSDDEIAQKAAELKSQEPSQAEKESRYNQAQGYEGNAGAFQGGLSNFAGDVLHQMGGVLRPFSSRGYQWLQQEGNAAKLVAPYRNQGEGAKDTGESIAQGAGEMAPQLLEMMALPGGAEGKFAFLGASQAAGEGKSISKTAEAGLAGYGTGKVFGLAEGVENPLARLGTVFGGSAAINAAQGMPIDQNIQSSLLNTAFEVTNIYGTKAAGKLYRFWQGGEPYDLHITEKGGVDLLPTDPNRQITGGEVITDPKNPVYSNAKAKEAGIPVQDKTVEAEKTDSGQVGASEPRLDGVETSPRVEQATESGATEPEVSNGKVAYTHDFVLSDGSGRSVNDLIQAIQDGKLSKADAIQKVDAMSYVAPESRQTVIDHINGLLEPPAQTDTAIDGKPDSGDVVEQSDGSPAKSVEAVSEALKESAATLPDIGNNHIRPLSDFAPTLYRETNADKALDLLLHANKDDQPYLANTPNLAKGQGVNKGVIVELKSDGLQGQVNRKPGSDLTYQNGEAEFVGKYNDNYADNIQKVTITSEAKGQKRAAALSNTLERERFTKEAQPNGDIVFTRADKATTPVLSESQPNAVDRADDLFEGKEPIVPSKILDTATDLVQTDEKSNKSRTGNEQALTDKGTDSTGSESVKGGTPKKSGERSLPKTLEAAGLEKGDNLTYEPERINGLERGRAVIADKGIEGAKEFVRSGQGIDWAPTGFAVMEHMRNEIADVRKTDPEKADQLYKEQQDFVNNFAEGATTRGQSIAGIKAVEEYAPDRAAYIANKLSQKVRGRSLTPSEDARITDLGTQLERERNRSKALEDQLAQVQEKPKVTKKETYLDTLEKASADAKKTVLDRIGKLDLSSLQKEKVFEGQKGAIGEKKALDGDAELIAQYAAGRLHKVPTVDALNKELLDTFGKDIEPHLQDIRDRAYQIRQDARLEALKSADTTKTERRTILQDIRTELADVEKQRVEALKKQATSSNVTERIAAKDALKELTDEKKQKQQELIKARAAEQSGFRAEIRAKQQSAKEAAFWDAPVRTMAADARERLQTADPKSPDTMTDLARVGAEKFLRESPGGTPGKRAIAPSQFYREMQAEFPGLVTDKNKGEIYKQSYQQIQDVTDAARTAARLRTAQGQSQKVWNDHGVDVDQQALLIQQAANTRRQMELRSAMANEFQRVSQSKFKRIAKEVINTPRAMMTSLNMHQGRQGLFTLLTHPIDISIKQSIPATWKGFNASKADFLKYTEELKQSPGYDLAKESGLNFAELPQASTDAKGHIEEDILQSTFAQKLPWVRKSTQGFILGMNVERLALFNKWAAIGEANGYTMENNPKFFKDAASVANDFTGRGTAPEAIEKAMKATNQLFFAPRLKVSQVKAINDLFNPYKYFGKGQYDPVMRQIMAKTALRAVAGFSVAYATAIALGGKGTDDPDDPDFGKVVFGHTHYDLTGGAGATFKFAYKFLRSVGGFLAGEKQKPFDTPLSIAESFARKKLAPWPSAVLDYFTTKDAVGQPANLNFRAKDTASKLMSGQFSEAGENAAETMRQNIALKMVLPMIVNEVTEGVADDGWKGLGKTLPASLVGLTEQTYAPSLSAAQKELKNATTDADAAQAQADRTAAAAAKAKATQEKFKVH